MTASPRLGFGGLSALAFNRYARNRLRIAPGTSRHLQLAVEQEPRHQKAVRLRDSRDPLGRFDLELDLPIIDADARRTAGIRVAILPFGVRVGEVLPSIPAAGLLGNQAKPHGTFHPVGTCRMRDDHEAALDFARKVRVSVLSFTHGFAAAIGRAG